MLHFAGVFMATCDQCGTTILFGDKREGDFRFCSDKCWEKGYVQPRLNAVPPDMLEQELKNLHQGSCPRCGGPGPVDLHTAHKIWSAIYATGQSSKAEICCRKCGLKMQALSALFCFFAGWWSLHGLILTPFSILANVAGMLRPPKPDAPSRELRKTVHGMLAARLSDPANSPGAPAAPVPVLPKSAATTTAPPTPSPPRSSSASASGPFSDIGKPLN